MSLPNSIQKPLDAVSNAIVERFRNPFAASFIISWVLFNWKPIVFLLWAKHPIEWSIGYVEKAFSDRSHYFWFPLCSAIFYSVFLPYISVGIDWLLKYYISYRNKSLVVKQVQAINNKKAIVIANIELEEAEKERRELKAHNKSIDDLQARNKSLEEQLEVQAMEHRTSYEALKDRYTEISKSNHEEVEELQKQIKKIQGQYDQLALVNNKTKNSLIDILNALKESGLEFNESLLKFSNGVDFIEWKIANNVFYFTPEDRIRINQSMVDELKTIHPYIKDPVPMHLSVY